MSLSITPRAATPKAPGSRRTLRPVGDHRRIEGAYLWMLVPAFILFTGLIMVPLLEGIFYTFTNFQGYGNWHFIGLRNYQALFGDQIIWQSYRFTLTYAVTGTILVNVIALGIALLLNARIAAKNAWRGLFFVPYLLPVLIIAYVFTYLFTNNLPAIGSALGVGWLSTSLLANEHLAWLAIVVVGVWQAVAFNTLIYLAGLQTVPSEVYEAADVDGAVGWRKFSQITFPLIMPYFTINMVLSFKNFLGVFDQVVAMTNGGPGTSTQSIAFLIFSNGFKGGEYAYQTANGVIYFLIVLAISFVQLRFLQGKERV